MSEFESFIQSERARAVLREAIDNKDEEAHGDPSALTNGAAVFHYRCDPPSPWFSVSVMSTARSPEWRRRGVYYRPDGDRFIVSDLGDGLKALRLRTGISMAQADAAIVEYGAFGAHFMGPEVGLRCDSAGLPDAICRTLLASYRIANLGAKGGE